MSKPSTNPKIDETPLSFVRLQSRANGNIMIDGNHYIGEGKFTDLRGVKYEIREGILYRVTPKQTKESRKRHKFLQDVDVPSEMSEG
jgi:hypothetical protein